MNWFNQDILYSIPDEIGSFADCSLNSSVIQCLNRHNHDRFKHIPCSLTNIIITYTNELFGCVIESETKYRKLRHEFKSKIYSIVVDSGVECVYEACDKGDDIFYMIF